MNKIIITATIFIFLITGCRDLDKNRQKVAGNSTERLLRKDSFFGLHFDLHAQERDSMTGATLTEGMIDYLLNAVKPDYIQVDCKGHPGISSYPTEVGFQTSGYVGDPLERWRKVTAKNGVTLYMHFSGIYDRKVSREFPEWTVIRADGSRSDQILSVFSPYDDTYLIPQLKELAGKYKVDGVWVDGECWAYEPDYGAQALKNFKEKTGITSVPRKPDDPYYFEFIEFQRGLFKEHVRHYLDEVHREYPDFQITSNWAFSSMMPEPVTLDMDYLSGDLTPGNAVNRAAFEARCMASQGMPWDLMAWSFSWDPGRSVPNDTKSALQLNQELAEVMAMGGGVQVYFRQNSDISIQPWTVSIMSEIAEFCRARQPWCEDAIPVPQIGILYSGYAYRKGLKNVYGAWDESLKSLIGVNTALLDGHHCTEILMEHHLPERGNRYPLIIVPEWKVLGEGIKEWLVGYIEKGGNLLLIGPGPVMYFKEESGFPDMKISTQKTMFIENNGRLCNFRSDISEVKPGGSELFVNKLYSTNDLRYQSDIPASVIIKYGKGKIGMINFNLGENYFDGSHFVMRDFLMETVDMLHENPIVKVDGSHLVHVTINKLDNSLLLSLINTAGNHANPGNLGFDEIPGVGPLKISVRYEGKPASVRLQPGNKKLAFKYRNELLSFDIPELEIYSIVEIK